MTTGKSRCLIFVDKVPDLTLKSKEQLNLKGLVIHRCIKNYNTSHGGRHLIVIKHHDTSSLILIVVFPRVTAFPLGKVHGTRTPYLEAFMIQAMEAADSPEDPLKSKCVGTFAISPQRQDIKHLIFDSTVPGIGKYPNHKRSRLKIQREHFDNRPFDLQFFQPPVAMAKC